MKWFWECILLFCIHFFFPSKKYICIWMQCFMLLKRIYGVTLFLFKMHSHMNMFCHVVRRCIEWFWQNTAYRYLALQLIGWSPCLWTLGYQIISSTTTSASTSENVKSASLWKKLMNPPLYGVTTINWRKWRAPIGCKSSAKLCVLLCFDTVIY